MKDIPAFSTENGVASLSLQQIPYTGSAHITIHSTQCFDAFLQECVGFCRAVGAQQILACGHEGLREFPVFTQIIRMQSPVLEGNNEDCLFPVTEETVDRWIEIYNAGMKDVSNALILSKGMGASLLQKGYAYFVHSNGELLGIGIVEGNMIDAIVSYKKGMGERVMKALCSAICDETVVVEVAHNNRYAMSFYHRLGFTATNIVKTWYEVTKKF